MQQPSDPVLVVLDKVDSYHSQVVTGIRAELTSLRVPLLVYVCGVHNSVPPSLTRLVENRRLRGVLLTGMDDPDTQRKLSALLRRHPELPLVKVGGSETEVAVQADNALGMRLIARHLVEDCGARRILAVRGFVHHPDSAEREAALASTLAELGVDLPEDMILCGSFHREETFRAVHEAIMRGVEFDAVVAFDDRSAFGALDALAEAGIRVPQDVLVTGFDDDVGAALSTPSLTTVSQNLGSQGATAARLLLDLAEGGEPRLVRTPVSLLKRESTGSEVRDAPPQEQLWTRLATLDSVLEISRSVLAERTLEDVVRRMSGNLPRLAISRAFLVHRLDEPGPPRGLMAFTYHDEEFADTSEQSPFDLATLLPDHLAHHLTDGTLTVHHLGAGDDELGYLLIDQPMGDHAMIIEALGIDLTRALEAVRSTARLSRHADELEALVRERTQQLDAEIATRRRAEDELRRLNDELRRSLAVDGLTGIANRKALEETLAVQWAGHSRAERPLSMLMVDVDHFKAYNDRYGHLQGDEALRTVATCLREAVKRVGDVAARYGGEEFALVMPNTDEDGALRVARRLRELLARAAIPHEASPSGDHLTVSIGIATVVPGDLETPQDLVAAADEALYDAKRSGRDGVRVCHRLQPSRRAAAQLTGAPPAKQLTWQAPLPAAPQPAERSRH